MISRKIIDGRALAEEVLFKVKSGVSALHCNVRLAIVLVGSNDASAVYVRNKMKRAKDVGIDTYLIQLADTVSEDEILHEIDKCNTDNSIHGIIVQLPLPKHISIEKVMRRVSVYKDVDGFHPENIGLLYSGMSTRFIPCTPKGCLYILQKVHGDLSGKVATVIGRSNIVGRPVGALLLRHNVTVNMCHSYTPDIRIFSQNSDIVITAVGMPNYFDADYFKDGTTVIDVGINRLDAGNSGDKVLTGDVDFASVISRVGHITPVPGGVGPMTIACLLENTLIAAQRHNDQ